MTHAAAVVASPTYSLGPLHFVFGGKESILNDIKTRDLHKELEQVLREAGVTSGQFQVSAQTKTKGTAHTKGLRIGVFSVSHRRIEFTWHAGSNDNCVQLGLSVPTGYNVEQFRNRLLAAQKSLTTQRVEKKPEKKKAATPEAKAAPAPTPTPIPAMPVQATDQLKRLRELTAVLEKAQGAETRKDNLRRDIDEAKVRLTAARRSVEIEETGLAQLEGELTEVETLLESPELVQAKEFASLLS
jgi:hypothetical protein